jgi:hypothetical protein
MSMDNRYWFRARDYGWGWTPATWQGWTVMLAYMFGIAGWLAYHYAHQEMSFGIHTDFVPAIPILMLTTILVAICWWKGEKPRWKWGKG